MELDLIGAFLAIAFIVYKASKYDIDSQKDKKNR